jgi:hypothetical protein
MGACRGRAEQVTELTDRHDRAFQAGAKRRLAGEDDLANDRNIEPGQRSLYCAAVSMILPGRVLKHMTDIASCQMLHPIAAVQRAGDVATIGLRLDHHDGVQSANDVVYLRQTELIGKNDIMQRGIAKQR